MAISIAHLGPQGTYAEAAALAYAQWLKQHQGRETLLRAYPSIAQTLQASASGETDLTVVPVENSIEGGVTITLDTLWQLDKLRIQHALVLPISHALLSRAKTLETVSKVYSHPQALAQCQRWLEQFLPTVRLIPTNSTTEALQHLDREPSIGAIASRWAAQLYKLPILAYPINDHSDNCTKFWILSLQPSRQGNHTSIAFSLPVNAPGALLKPLQLFAATNINLSRIESRPTKRSLGDYLFFVDLESDINQTHTQAALKALESCTETLKIFGSYETLSIADPWQGGDGLEISS
ncbi:MAG: prephenate dehydratase [Pseudanabaenales cyanobacterium]|nr:prephenate dehydratase [Pseudanabaenales cyanobacterium]